MKKFWFILAAVLALVVGSGALAYASIPDGGGVIHGCYKTGNPAKGAVTVVDSGNGETCPSGTTPLNWNQAGPSGPPGLAGVHVVTLAFAGGGTGQISCPSGETAVSIAFGTGYTVGFAYSATPTFGSNGVTPVGYSVSTETPGTFYATCATTS